MKMKNRQIPMRSSRRAAILLAVCCATLFFSANRAAAQNTGGFDPGSLFGNQGGKFDVVGAEGEQSLIQDPKTGEVVSYTADGKFRYRSKDMDLDCDHLVYTAASGLLVATGSPCKIRNDKVKSTCRNFEYTTKDQKIVLTGNPVIHNEDGTTVNAKRIKIIKTKEGYNQMIIEAGTTHAGQSSGSASAPPAEQEKAVITRPDKPAETPKSKVVKATQPVRIDEGKLDKIPAVDIDE